MEVLAGAPPLSPSRLSNATSAVEALNAAPKRMVFEEEDADVDEMLAEEEAWRDHMGLASSSQSHEGTSLSSQGEPEPEEQVDKSIIPTPFYVSKGKEKMVLEPEEGFEVPSDVEMPSDAEDAAPAPVVENVRPRPAPPAKPSPAMWIDLMPVTATTFDGARVSFRRRRKLEALRDTVAEQVRPLHVSNQLPSEEGDKQKENAASYAQLSKTMMKVPYHQMVAAIAKERKIKAADACVCPARLVS
jgi:hypothetical protein